MEQVSRSRHVSKRSLMVFEQLLIKDAAQDSVLLALLDRERCDEIYEHESTEVSTEIKR